MLSASYGKQISIQTEPFVYLNDRLVGITTTSSLPFSYEPGIDFGKKFGQFQAGLTYSTLNNRLTFNYNYQQINTAYLLGIVTYLSPSYSFTEYSMEDKQIQINRLGVDANIINNSNFKWRSAFNVSMFINKLADPDKKISPNYYVPDKNYVTGGFVNRFGYKKITAGIDVLYCFNQDRYSGYITQHSTYNSFNMQNIYVGYNFKAFSIKDIEVYANSRNMLMNPTPPLQITGGFMV